MAFSELGLTTKIARAVNALPFDHPTPIQAQAIPYAADGRDILACAKTGSGKTLAFVLPILHRLATQRPMTKRDPRALILAPTRELAKQVFMECKNLCASLPLKVSLVIGGDNYNDQVKQLRKDPHIVVGTAGRIADHLDDKTLYLHGLEILVYDEADRMLDLGFSEHLVQIHRQADHRKRQTMLFSATLDNPKIQPLLDSLLRHPQTITLDEGFALHDNIAYEMYFSDGLSQKEAMLSHFCRERTFNQAIVFVATRDDADRLCQFLTNLQCNAISLHAEKSQSARNQIINAFSRGHHDILVTTDLASRGLDLRKVELVINFDMPKHAEEFIHRVGRTGRANDSGTAISLVSKKDWQSWTAIKRLLKTELSIAAHPDFPTNFSGIIARTAISPSQSAKQAPSAQQTKTRVTRVDTSEGTDVGALPIKRKSRRNILEDNEEE